MPEEKGLSRMPLDEAVKNLFNIDNLSWEEITATMKSIVQNKCLFSPDELSRIFGKVTKFDGEKTLAYSLAQWGYDFSSIDLLNYGNPADNRNWTIAHLMAKRGYIFTLGELLKLKNPIDSRNLSVADVMMFMGHKFSEEGEMQLGIDHINFEYSAYAGFCLSDYFTNKPKMPSKCPKCQYALTWSLIELSDAAFDGIGMQDYFHHDGSFLFICDNCKWWCVREGWFEYERGFEGDVLLIGIAKSRRPEHPVDEKPWENALKNKDAYMHDLKLPNNYLSIFPDYLE
jgi:hypothetical protein